MSTATRTRSVVVAALAVTIVAGTLLSSINAPLGAPAAPGEVVHAQMQTPTPVVLMAAPGPVSASTTAEWVSESNVVADVTVQFEGQLSFNTPGGAMPTPDPTGNTFEGDFLYKSVVLTVSQLYKGDAGVTGYVVPEFGGTLSGRTYSVNPNIEFSAPGQGMTFLEAPPSEWQSDPPPWFAAADQLAQQMSVGGAVYKAMLNYNWYAYHGASADSEFTGRSLPIQQLRQEVLDSL